MSERQTFAGSEAGRYRQPRMAYLGLSAIGVVFGDIGTSPLYTFKTILGATAKSPNAASARSAFAGALDPLHHHDG
ncbi:MAG: KUP/HAK/KT family potassium transporter, partial [Bradyrhizobium sp.]